jgi:hypothetical protein
MGSMVTAEAAPGTTLELTPSEILLLHCDEFAPIPPLTRAVRAEFEWETAAPFLIAVIFPIIFFAVADQVSLRYMAMVRVGALTAAVGIVIGWWFRRRRLNPLYDREGIEHPLGGKAALSVDLIPLTISAALLASERAGVLTFRDEGGRLYASFDDARSTWPPNSLEGRLVRGRTLAVADLIYDWLADGSNFPQARAMRLIVHCATLRGVTKLSTAQSGDSHAVRALLDACRTGRPALWTALESGIAEGIRRRTVAPRQEDTGGHAMPRYDYAEAAIESMDAPDGAVAIAPGSTPKVASTGALILVILICLGASALVVAKLRPQNLSALLTLLVALPLALIVFSLFAKRLEARRAALRRFYGLPAEAVVRVAPGTNIEYKQTLMQVVAGNAALVAVAALITAFGGAMVILFALGLVGLIAVKWMGDQGKLTAKTAAEVVSLRLNALKASAAEVPSADPPAPPPYAGAHPGARSTPRIPDPVAASELPPAPAECTEAVERWRLRRAKFRRLYWVSLAVLAGGYMVIALTCLLLRIAFSQGSFSGGDLGNSIVALALPLFASTIFFHYTRWAGAVEDDQGKTRHAMIAAGVAFWRVILLLEAPLLFAQNGKPYLPFAFATLLLLVVHWAWMEWARARLMRQMPVPAPHRLLMLRVFGSPAFDDLVTLIHPWQRVGLIEHLEGFDTVGQRADVQLAVEAHQIDSVLAKDLLEVQRQLAQASTEPGPALLFERHAFQCTDATWREAILGMLKRADVVLMDLSSLSLQNQGCAWELGQLLDHVPLRQVTLLVNDSTDLACLRSILERAAARMSPDSPNWNQPDAAWQLIRVGGLSARQPNESFYDWQRRTDHRLDPNTLTAWLLSTAPANEQAAPLVALAAARRWSRQARWQWAALLALSARFAFASLSR